MRVRGLNDRQAMAQAETERYRVNYFPNALIEVTRKKRTFLL